MPSIYHTHYTGDYTRIVRFHVITDEMPGPINEICSVSQDLDAVTLTIRAPELDWWAWSGQKDPATVRLVARAFSDAADLLEQWSKDTGKPYKEVLQ